MKAYDVDKGDAVHPGDPVVVDRYTPAARVNHWITAACLVLLAISGLSLFDPSLFFLSALFGGGQAARAIHPWIGVVLFFSFAGLFLRFWKANLWRAEDGTWLAHLRDVLTNREDKATHDCFGNGAIGHSSAHRRQDPQPSSRHDFGGSGRVPETLSLRQRRWTSVLRWHCGAPLPETPLYKAI